MILIDGDFLFFLGVFIGTCLGIGIGIILHHATTERNNVP